jgi:hypothetical protein
MRNYLTLREAAALSGMTPVDVLALCRDGVVRARTVRGRRRVHREAQVAALAREGEQVLDPILFLSRAEPA